MSELEKDLYDALCDTFSFIAAMDGKPKLVAGRDVFICIEVLNDWTVVRTDLEFVHMAVAGEKAGVDFQVFQHMDVSKYYGRPLLTADVVGVSIQFVYEDFKSPYTDADDNPFRKYAIGPIQHSNSDVLASTLSRKGTSFRMHVLACSMVWCDGRLDTFTINAITRSIVASKRSTAPASTVKRGKPSSLDADIMEDGSVDFLAMLLRQNAPAPIWCTRSQTTSAGRRG